MTHFGDRLAAKVRQKNSSVCVGIDPRWNSLPELMTAGVEATDLAAVAEVTCKYCCGVLDAVAESTGVVKPQAAFFELLGPAGMLALSQVIEHAQKLELLVLLDGKRGDIGSTAEGYATAYLGPGSAWGCDALTVNPYLGDDTLMPFVDRANATGSGIFTLVKTSNPGSGYLQDKRLEGGETIYQRVADTVQELSAAKAGASGYGNVGAVVGATYPEQLAELRARMPAAWLLIPGFGAQGGTAADVRHGYDSAGLGAIVNSSRGITFAYQQDQYSGLDWQAAVSQAARDMAAQLPPSAE